MWIWPGYVFYNICLIAGYIHSRSGNLNYCNRCGGGLFFCGVGFGYILRVGLLSACIFDLYLFLFAHVSSSLLSVVAMSGSGDVIDRYTWFVVILYFVFLILGRWVDCGRLFWV